MASQNLPIVSIITPVHNGSAWLDECLQSVLRQSYTGPIEMCVYDDASQDNSREIVESMRRMLEERSISLKVAGHTGCPKGVGFARNKAMSMCSGEYLCFLDADDVMHEDRLACQLALAIKDHSAIVGSRFHREPPESTIRFTQWANHLTPDQLYTQAYTSHGPTIIMPTWFCHRKVVESVGNFHESGKGTPEDLLFFYEHLNQQGTVLRVDKDLLMYRYHPHCQSFSVSEETIWKHRVSFLEHRILDFWSHFAIWNAGKQGRKLFRALSPSNRAKVSMFCDVDEKKIEKKYYEYQDSAEVPKPRIPIVHFTQVKPPLVICVKLNLSGNFEQNLESLRLKEGRDYIHFN